MQQHLQENVKKHQLYGYVAILRKPDQKFIVMSKLTILKAYAATMIMIINWVQAAELISDSGNYNKKTNNYTWHTLKLKLILLFNCKVAEKGLW